MKRFYCFETKKWYKSGTAAAKELGIEKLQHIYHCADSIAAGCWLGYKYHFLREEDIEKFLQIKKFKRVVLNENKIQESIQKT